MTLAGEQNNGSPLAPSQKPASTLFVRSNWLPQLHEFASQIPALAPFLGDHLQLKLVIDANFVHRELQWRLKSRIKPDVRTRLHESAESGVLVLFAPVQLEAEIQEHLGDIAQRSGATVEQARVQWEAFRPTLHFYKPQSLALRRGIAVVDPDDLPYIAACNELGAHAVYTKDKHFRQMEAPVISVAIDASLQTYARASSVRFAIMVGSVFSVTISIEAIKAAVGVIGKGFQAFRKLHPLLQFAIVAALVFVFVDPKTRAKLASFWKILGSVAKPVLEAVTLAAQHLEIASVNIDLAKKEIEAVLPPPRRRSALAHARAICILLEKPISLRDLEAEIKAEGYKTQARDFGRYLKRKLKSSGQFVETAEGWLLQIEAVSVSPLVADCMHV